MPKMMIALKPNFTIQRYGPVAVIQFSEDTPAHNTGSEFAINLDLVVGLEEAEISLPSGQSVEGVRVLTVNPHFAPFFDRADQNGPVRLTASELGAWLLSKAVARGRN